MTARPYQGPDAEHGVLDANGHLIEADARLAELHRSAGGRPGGMLAVPQVAALARLARRLGIPISRGAIAAEDEHDLELWVRAEPQGDRTLLTISGWKLLPARRPHAGADEQRDTDYARAAADWVWETDESLRLTLVSGSAAAAGANEADWIRKPLTSLFRFRFLL